jgi:hypothetical protein
LLGTGLQKNKNTYKAENCFEASKQQVRLAGGAGEEKLVPGASKRAVPTAAESIRQHPNEKSSVLAGTLALK